MEISIKELLLSKKIKKGEETREIKILNSVVNYLREKIKSGDVELVVFDSNGDMVSIEIYLIFRFCVLKPEDSFSYLYHYISKIQEIKDMLEKAYFFYSDEYEKMKEEVEKNE